MSESNYTSFYEELQEKYEIKQVDFFPKYHPQEGMLIHTRLKEHVTRDSCPVCSSKPIIHGYIKNGAFWYIEWNTSKI